MSDNQQSQIEQLLSKVPAHLRDNVRYFATDSTGMRTAFFDKPFRRDFYWDSTGPYHCLKGHPDPEGAKDWENSLIKV